MIADLFDKGWYQKLEPFFHTPEFAKLKGRLAYQHEHYELTPDLTTIFRAFKECPYSKLKVVLLGLDPYPKRGVADGLAFSARNFPLDPPSSLQFMINSMEKDAYNGFGIGFNGDYCNPDLTRWANQGVLLLNTALTTIVDKVGVHTALWHPFIKEVFRILKDNNTGIIYLLLGTNARAYEAYIDEDKNHIMHAVHPNYCYHRGLKEWDCNGIFSKTNFLLEKMNGPESKIQW